MRKIYFLVILFMVSLSSLFAQSFQKGSMVIDGSANLGIYETMSKNLLNDSITHDHAGVILFPFTAEYGVTDWLGAALQFDYSNYIEGKDTTTNQNNNRVNGIDIIAKANFHFVRTKRTDILFGPNIGYTHISSKAHDTLNASAAASGFTFGGNLQSRFYFGEVFGIFLNLGYHFHNYPKLAFYDDNHPDGINDFKLNLKGVNFGIGLMFKLK